MGRIHRLHTDGTIVRFFPDRPPPMIEAILKVFLMVKASIEFPQYRLQLGHEPLPYELALMHCDNNLPVQGLVCKDEGMMPQLVIHILFWIVGDALLQERKFRHDR